jgi:hypothetical protein
MTFLLQQRGDEVKIAEDVVKAAAYNLGGKGLLKLLLERGPTLLITDKIGRVQTMRDIYTKATRVVIWQGKPPQRPLLCLILCGSLVLRMQTRWNDLVARPH